MSNISTMFDVPFISGCLFGIELEVESVHNYVVDNIPHVLNITEDHSLRNQGFEFISHPISYSKALSFFKAVFHDKDAVSYVNKEERCHERGSIHVHVNVSDLSPSALFNLISAYYVSEPEWFARVSPERQGSIYCVPLSCTSVMHGFGKQSLNSLASTGNWHKYTAFNLLPVKSQGTVEFRHHHCTDDLVTFSNWLKFIEDWRALGQRPLNTWEEVKTFIYQVFGQPLALNACRDNWETLMCYSQNVSPETIIARIKEQKCVA